MLLESSIPTSAVNGTPHTYPTETEALGELVEQIWGKAGCGENLIDEDIQR